jgi:DNA repair protein RAD57
MTYQLPVVLSRYRIGLIVLDSVTANYRAEFDRPQTSQRSQSQASQMIQRSKDLRKLAGILKDLAIEWNVAVVAVNQVTDAFKRSSSQVSGGTHQDDLLSSHYQTKWFDGLIDENGVEGTKRPALGLVWTNLITSRIMLVREKDGHSRIKVVFSPFAKPGSLLYAISSETGVHAIEMPHQKPDDVSLSNGGNASQEVFSDDFDLKVSDVEFSDFDVEDILSGELNV